MTHDNTEDETRIVPMVDDEGGAPIYNENGVPVALYFASFQEVSVPAEDEDTSD